MSFARMEMLEEKSRDEERKENDFHQVSGQKK